MKNSGSTLVVVSVSSSWRDCEEFVRRLQEEKNIKGFSFLVIVDGFLLVPVILSSSFLAMSAPGTKSPVAAESAFQKAEDVEQLRISQNGWVHEWQKSFAKSKSLG